MIPWPLFLVLAQQIPRLEMRTALDVATGVAFGYLDARTGKRDAGRGRLDLAFRRARQFADGTEDD